MTESMGEIGTACLLIIEGEADIAGQLGAIHDDAASGAQHVWSIHEALQGNFANVHEEIAASQGAALDDATKIVEAVGPASRRATAMSRVIGNVLAGTSSIGAQRALNASVGRDRQIDLIANQAQVAHNRLGGLAVIQMQPATLAEIQALFVDCQNRAEAERGMASEIIVGVDEYLSTI